MTSESEIKRRLFVDRTARRAEAAITVLATICAAVAAALILTLPF